MFTVLTILSDILAVLLLQLLFIQFSGITITIGFKKSAYTYSKGYLSVVKCSK
jgi:hypothetical protein